MFRFRFNSDLGSDSYRNLGLRFRFRFNFDLGSDSH